VDVLYRMAAPRTPGAPLALQQRMRWAAGTGMLRIDPPSPGLYMIVDYRDRHLFTVRDAARSVVRMDGAGPAPNGAAAGAPFARHGTATIAGLACTEWQTVDVGGAPALACITDDGVLLRATRGDQVLLEAASVHYGAQDPALFRLPEGYAVTTAPAKP